jgi:hypothetical protein
MAGAERFLSKWCALVLSFDARILSSYRVLSGQQLSHASTSTKEVERADVIKVLSGFWQVSKVPGSKTSKVLRYFESVVDRLPHREHKKLYLDTRVSWSLGFESEIDHPYQEAVDCPKSTREWRWSWTDSVWLWNQRMWDNGCSPHIFNAFKLQVLGGNIVPTAF